MALGKGLTDKQELFCQEYLKDLNASAAARRAGYSEKSSDKIACQLMEKTRVSERISELLDQRSKRTEITSDQVLRELLLIAKADLSQAYDEKGNLKPIHEIPEGTRRAIAGVKVFEEFEGYGKERVKIGVTRELKFWDKNRSLELLGKHLKLFTDKIEHSGNLNLENLSDEELATFKRIYDQSKKKGNR